jgi:hypothetical protein
MTKKTSKEAAEAANEVLEYANYWEGVFTGMIIYSNVSENTQGKTIETLVRFFDRAKTAAASALAQREGDDE